MCCRAFTVGEAEARRRGLVSRPRVRQTRLCRVQRGLLGSLRTLDLLAQLLSHFCSLLLSSVPSNKANQKFERKTSARQAHLHPWQQEVAACVFPRERRQVFVECGRGSSGD